MQRLKVVTGWSMGGALYAAALYGLARFFVTDEIPLRHGGWTTFAEAPFHAALGLFVIVAITLAGPILVWLESTGRRGRERKLRMLDRRRLLDIARRQNMTGRDLT